MRGTPSGGPGTRSGSGNTPADAGNSLPLALQLYKARKHPRRCGELPTVLAVLENSSETPPQMRGTRDSCYSDLKWARNTPADAGNSDSYGPRRGRRRKHPRRCGELPSPSLSCMSWSETPPQMRGTLPNTMDKREGSGNTPADAGNSEMEVNIS